MDFRRGEEPKLLLSQNLPVKGQSLIALSPDAHTAAVAIERSVYLYGCSTGALLETMVDCHEGKMELTLRWDLHHISTLYSCYQQHVLVS